MFKRREVPAASIDQGRVACPRRAGDQDVEACLACPDVVEVGAAEVRCRGWEVTARDSRLEPSEYPLYGAANLP